MAIITEDYVSFETAKLLKEKRFTEPCRYYYFSDGSMHRTYGLKDRNCASVNTYSAPTLQMACKWLRKNHQIFIRPNTSFLYPIKWYSEIFCYGDNLKTQQDVKTECYASYEEACEVAIRYCLENLI